jgi:aminodeoxyfutalosine deaminase
MTVYRAAWICPIVAPPIRDGWIAVRAGRIDALGSPGQPPPEAARDLGRVAILPGLVNAHTHLELSWLRGRVPPAVEFIDWIKQLLLTRGARVERSDDSRVIEAAGEAVSEARRAGTVAVGDIGNSLASVPALRDAGLDGLVFHELLGFNQTDGRLVDQSRPQRRQAAANGDGRVRISVAPHAPYSVSAELFRAIRAEVDRSRVPITSVHVGESKSEMQLLLDGSGPWPGILRMIGVSRPDWRPPGTGPVEYLDSLSVLDDRTLVVHAVQLDDTSLGRLARIGCTVVTCPRSNQWVGVGVPPVARFYDSGVAVAVGTDSLASVEDLNLFSELKTMRWLAPGISARRLLESATLIGARALGLGDDLGSIEAGKRAELITVELPQEVEDVEEHLLSGVDSRRIHWVAA